MSVHLIEIADPSQDRYATLHLIPWWNQASLAQARVMVVGAGALGNEVLKNLALLGVGHVLIADFDVVDASNLTRSALFRQRDAGRRKVDVAAEGVRDINPDVQVATFHGDITRDLGLGVYRQMDVVLGCLDNRAARLSVNRACWRLGVPWIDGALDVLMGTVRIFMPPAGACYECMLTEQDYALINLRYSCPLLRPEDLAEGRLLTTPTSASIIAGLQVQEAVKLLHGLDVPAGKSLYFNGQTHQLTMLTLTRRADCYSHEPYAEIIALETGVDDLTIGTFFAVAEAITGQSVTLLLDEEIVTRFYCPQCEQFELIYQPYDMVVPAHVSCPHCNVNRIPRVAVRLLQEEAAAQIPLRQIGIPPWQILRAETAHRQYYFELANDKELIVREW